MKYYSTANPQHEVTLQQAVLQGLAPDSGLYMPKQIPALSKDWFDHLQDRSFREIAGDVARAFIQDDIPAERLQKIIEHTIAFDAPLVSIEPNIFALELFHGPTLAFKDFGARFMSQVLGYFAEVQQKEIVVLAATSGDTGSAVANGFLGVPGITVVVLYPSGMVSEIQEKQFTTLGKNVIALEVDGTFDDCQRLVKQSFLDADLQEQFFLTSANSINIARLLPQMFYYFYGWSRLQRKEQIVFSVPSGNFGNLAAGLMTKRMGLPIDKFLAATNRNDIVPHYLTSKLFQPKSSIATISNAMDVGNPSNFERILNLYHHSHEHLSKDVSGAAFSDDQTAHAMRLVYDESHYMLDPHGAIGYLALKSFLHDHPTYTGVFLETAHPAKFKSTVEGIVKTTVTLPESLQKFLVLEKKSIPTPNNFAAFARLLRQLL